MKNIIQVLKDKDFWMRIVFIISASLFIITGSAHAQIQGLVAAYSFDEGKGNIVRDYSGYNNMGALKSGPVWVEGKYGKGLFFDGIDDRVTINDSNSLDLSKNLTIEAWVRPMQDLRGWRSIIFKGQSDYLVYALYASSDSNRPAQAISVNDEESQLYGNNRLAPHTWAHLAVTYDGKKQSFYIDGELICEMALQGAIKESKNSLQIGGNTIWMQEAFRGIIDEVRIYSRALSQQEIIDDMHTAVASENGLFPDYTRYAYNFGGKSAPNLNAQNVPFFNPGYHMGIE